MDVHINSCPVCGATYQPHDMYCSKCGHLLDSNNTTSLEKQYIGKNDQYYTNKFFEMRVVGKDTSWNWAAFLWPAFWCIYRKMYFYGFGLLILQYVLNFAYLFGDLLNGAIGIAFGLYANHIYMQHIEQLLSKSMNLMGDQKQNHINKHGGVNLMGLIAVIVGTFCVAIAVVIL